MQLHKEVYKRGAALVALMARSGEFKQRLRTIPSSERGKGDKAEDTIQVGQSSGNRGEEKLCCVARQRVRAELAVYESS